MKKEDLGNLKNLLLDDAVKLLREGKVNEGIEKIETLKKAMSMLVPLRTTWVNDLLGIMAERHGEQQVFDYWREYATKRLDVTKVQSPLEMLKSYVIAHNGLGSTIKSVEETEDRYLLTLDPCGSIGAARRKSMIDTERGVTKKAYAFLWNKKGVPYYCVHCQFVGDVVPREKMGKPMFTLDWPEKPEGVCRYNFLK